MERHGRFGDGEAASEDNEPNSQSGCPQASQTGKKLFLVDVLEKLLSTTSFVLLLLAALEILGVPVSVLATAGGLGAAAVAFGAQNVVSNSLTGFSLYINRPFVVGDFIEIPSEKLSGFFERIG